MRNNVDSSALVTDPQVSTRSGRPWIILNLGCGTKTSSACVNIDWSLTVRLVSNPILRACASRLLNADQMKKVRRLDKVLAYNLRKGIPLPAETADGVYHSHVLEHIDRDAVMKFLVEIKRVMKQGAIHRIVVPDLRRLAQEYLEDFSDDLGTVDWRVHDSRVASMIEQMVRRKSAAVLGLGPVRQKIETLIFGDARGRGETHQWMYDQISLAGMLGEAGFREIRQVDYKTSRIPDWSSTGLDVDDDGVTEYKSESIYFECLK
jgi:SAM-dependent methyltransferase